MACDLCHAIKDAIWEEEKFFGLVCRTCGNHLIVYKMHWPKLTPAEQSVVDEIIARRYPSMRRRGYIREIPSHWHDHIIDQRGIA